MEFKFFIGQYNNYDIPNNHYIISVSPTLYYPRTLDIVRVVRYKHFDPEIEEVHRMTIGRGHYLWDWPGHS